jgi:CxxC-x17-CxxC domain-containing protein
MTATFADLGVRRRTLAGLERSGLLHPLQVQVRALPPLLERRDVVVEAPTGSGKTLAYLLPLVERLDDHRPGGPRALIVGPTRELVSQIAGVLRGLAPRLRVALLYGGTGYALQIAALRGGADVVVGCPGRILDLAGRTLVRLGRVEYLVLDEADEMLDQGFAPDVERIIALTPGPGATPPRQTVLASATMPAWVETMIERHLEAPAHIRVAGDQEPLLEHVLLRVERAEKVDALSTLLRRHGGSTIVFHRTKHGAKRLSTDLMRRGHRTAELQGNLSQGARDRAIAGFRDGSTHVLVATNVAARGLDVSHVGLVVNFELPDTPQWLTHRVGRTARNGAEGRALTLVGSEDVARWEKLRRLGAPDLPTGDLRHLLLTGELRLVAEPAAPAIPAPAPARLRRYSQQPRRHTQQPRDTSRPVQRGLEVTRLSRPRRQHIGFTGAVRATEKQRMPTDQVLHCRDCGADFTWTTGEQEFYASRGLTNPPSRCPDCRSARKAMGAGGGGGRSDRGGGGGGGGGGYGGGQREMHEVKCASCGGVARVPFVPRGDRPVYCRDCFGSGVR